MKKLILILAFFSGQMMAAKVADLELDRNPEEQEVQTYCLYWSADNWTTETQICLSSPAAPALPQWTGVPVPEPGEVYKYVATALNQAGESERSDELELRGYAIVVPTKPLPFSNVVIREVP